MKITELQPNKATSQGPARPTSPASALPKKANSLPVVAQTEKGDASEIYVTAPLFSEQTTGAAALPHRSVNPDTGMRVILAPNTNVTHSESFQTPSAFSLPPSSAHSLKLGNPALGRRNSTGSIFSPSTASVTPKSSQALGSKQTSRPATEPPLSVPLSRRSSVASLAPSATMSEASLEGAALLDAVATRTRSARRAMSFMVATGAVGALIGSMLATSALGPGAIPAFFLMWAGSAAIGYMMSKFQQRKLTRDDELMRMTQRLEELIENPPADMNKADLKKAEDIVGFVRGNVMSYGLAKGMRLMAKPLKVAQAPMRDWVEPKLAQVMDRIIDHQAARAQASEASKRGLRSESEREKEA